VDGCDAQIERTLGKLTADKPVPQEPLLMSLTGRLAPDFKTIADMSPFGAVSTLIGLFRRIDGLNLELPFAGTRMLRDLLRPKGSRSGAST